MSEDLIQQEYYCSFTAGVEGSFYGRYLERMNLNHQIGVVPYEVGFRVFTAWDLGINDPTVILFFQKIGHTIRIFDYYENKNMGLEHYAKIVKDKPYQYATHFGPHDIAVREFGTGMTRWEKAKRLGITFSVVPNHEIADGIETVRSSLSKIWIDDRNCASFIKAIENYRQEYDHKRDVYHPKPLHNWASHGADALRYLCMSLNKTEDGTTPEELDRRYAQTVYGVEDNLPPIFRNDLPPY